MSRPQISYPAPLDGSASSSRQDAYTAPRQVSSSSSRAPPTMIDSSITRLLVLTKQMLQAMEQWSQAQVTEEDVSDIYVKLGNGFEQCVDAFRKVGLSTKELDSIPNDLRICLEQALAEDPSQETLNVYLPNIRTIIFSLLNGLKQKQAAYKRLLVERQEKEQDQLQQRQQSQYQTRLDPVEEANAKLTGRSVSPNAPPGPLPRVPSSSMLAQRNASGPAPSRPAPPDAFRPARMRPPEGPRGRRSSATSSSGREPTPARVTPPPINISTTSLPEGMVRHQLTDNPVPPASTSTSVPTILAPAPSVKPTPPRPDRFSRDSFGNPRPISRFSVDSDITNGSPVRSPSSTTPPRRISTLPEDADEDQVPNSPPPTRLAPSLPVLNLPSESLSMDDTNEVKTPPLSQVEPVMPDVPQETRSTLAALSRQDPLERRASRRFSSYNFSKMLPGSPSSKKLSSPQRPMRRANIPPMPPLPEANLTKSMEEGLAARSHLGANGSSARSASPSSVRTPSPQPDHDTSMRILPTPNATPTPAAHTPMPTSLSVFLQIGRQVKKASLEMPTNLSSIKLCFMERFEYDPGKEDFPEVYIRDPRTGVQFELEDMDDLKDDTVLSLNIEPLDQVKQHFDLTVGSLMQEIKEMKSSLDHTRRLSMAPPSLMSLSPSMNMVATTSRIPKPEPMRISPSVSSSDLPSAPLTSDKRIELQSQYDEVTSLRRDLAVIRQVHVDFLAETKSSFAKLRTQNSAMREVVKTKMGGSRALLDNSKAKMETQCQEAIQAVEEISDTIDNAREDAYKRYVTPSAKQINSIKANLEKATNFVDQFARDVTLADPSWRSTWASELKRVQEEQGLLSHQRKLAADLKNDIKDAAEMFTAVQGFVSQRGAGQRIGSKGFRPPSPTQDSGGVSNLLMEIRTKEADPNQRLRAIEAQRKAREKELAERGGDEFTSELGNFVQGRKLKKTGGHEEVERVRAKKSEKTLKKMLTGDGGDQGVLSPQLTGASMLTAQTTGASMLTAQTTGASMLTAQTTGASMLTAQTTGASTLSAQTTGNTVLSPQLTGGRRLSVSNASAVTGPDGQETGGSSE